nr:hypothetical protein [Methanoculleus marisnigri]
MDLPDAVAMILALLTFTAILFSPSPAPPEAAGSGTPDGGQPAAARNISCLLGGALERLQSGHPLNLTPGPLPGTAGSPTLPDENETSENSTVPVPDYDDDELVRLVEENSVSLMLLSVQNTYALYAWDEQLAKESGATLQAFAIGLLKDSTALDVSGDRETLKTSFTLALESYRAAGEALQGNAPLNRTIVDTALEGNRQGSNHLGEAFGYLQSPVLEAPEEIVATSFSLPRLYAGSASGEELALLQRYIYEDRSRANEISLILESARSTGLFYFVDGSGKVVAAEPGRMFLLVEVKVTNLAHKSENRMYTIRTPAPRDFTLRYRGTSYSPITLAPGTSLGEPYAAATLGRYEVKTGYIVFDVPEALTLGECSIQVSLGDGSPVWALGKTL